MNDYVQKYIDSTKTENTKKVFRHVFNKINANNIENCNPMQMEQRILESKPNSPKAIITTVYVLSSYFKWLQEQNIIDNDNALQIDIFYFMIYNIFVKNKVIHNKTK